MWDKICQYVRDTTGRHFTHSQIKHEIVRDNRDFDILPKYGGEIALTELFNSLKVGDWEDIWEVIEVLGQISAGVDGYAYEDGEEKGR